MLTLLLLLAVAALAGVAVGSWAVAQRVSCG
jgi:hypothetical protein